MILYCSGTVAELMRQKCPEERDKNQEDVNLPLEEERMVSRRFISRKSGIPSSIYMGEKREEECCYYFEVCEWILISLNRMLNTCGRNLLEEKGKCTKVK